jgi:Protein of unknown function (DUF3300)
MNPVLRASTASVLTVVFSFVTTVSGCKSAPAPAPQEQAAAPAQAAPPPSPTAPINIDDLVAPIALYPDQLLAQILTASTNAQEVLDGGNWLLQNQSLKGDALTDAARTAGFSPPVQYLMSFPQVVDNMCQQIDWTRQLGQSFQADQKGVMEAVQRKRVQAQQTGNLKSSPQMTVETKKADNGQPYVEIQPANPQVVYVPQYNPVTIYNTPAPTTVVVTQPAPASTESALVPRSRSGFSRSALAWLSVPRSTVTTTIHIHHGAMEAFIMADAPTIRRRIAWSTLDIAQLTDTILPRTTTGTSTTETSM